MSKLEWRPIVAEENKAAEHVVSVELTKLENNYV